MKKIGLITGLLGLIMGMSLCTQRGELGQEEMIYYYYFQDEKVYLSPIQDKLILGIENGVQQTVQLQKLLDDYKLVLVNSGTLGTKHLLVETCRKQSLKSLFRLMQNLAAEPAVQYAYPWFKTLSANSSVIVPTNEILFAPKPGVDRKGLNQIMEGFDLQLDNDLAYGNFVLSIDGQEHRNVWDIANKLYETGKVEYAYPNFLSTPVY